MSSELTNDTTAAGRFFGGIILPFIILIPVSVVLYFIKPIRKYFDNIWWFCFIAMVVIVFFKSLFIPLRKTIFNTEKKELTIVKNTSLINSISVTLKWEKVEKIEYDFAKYHEGYSNQTIVYCQLFAVVNGKRVLIGENEVGDFGGQDKDWQPSEEQKSKAEKELAAL